MRHFGKLVSSILLVVWMLPLSTLTAHAATVYVSPGQSIQAAINSARPGDIIYIRGGTYNEHLVINRSGTITAPITLSNYATELVTINAGSYSGIRDASGSEYWIIKGLTITTTGASAFAIMATSAAWDGTVVSHWIVKNNMLRGGGVLIRGSYNTLQYNTINGLHVSKSGDDYNSGIREIWGGGPSGNSAYSHHNIFLKNSVHGFYRSGIWSMGYTHNDTFDGNTIYDIYGTGSGPGQCLDLDGAATVEWRHVVKNNNIYNCGAESIQMENVFDSLVENNYIHNTPVRGITLINYTASVGCATGGENNQYGDTNGDGSCVENATNNIIRQNVIVSAAGGGFVSYGMDGVHYLNNSMYNSGGMLFTDPAHEKSTDVIGNIISSTASLPTTLKSNRNNIRGASGVYTNPPSDLTPILGGSAADKLAAINLYTNSVSDAWTADFAGKPRLSGSLYDIGAYEYQH